MDMALVRDGKVINTIVVGDSESPTFVARLAAESNAGEAVPVTDETGPAFIGGVVAEGRFVALDPDVAQRLDEAKAAVVDAVVSEVLAAEVAPVVSIHSEAKA